MPKPLPESSLPPSHGGSSVFAIEMRPHEGTTKKSPAQIVSNLHEPCLVVVVVLVLLVLWFLTMVNEASCPCQHAATVSHCARALDNEELFVVEGSENWRSTPGRPRRARKMRKKRPKPLHRRHTHAKRNPSCCKLRGPLHNRDIVHLVDERQLQNLHSFPLCLEQAPDVAHNRHVNHLLQELHLWPLCR